MRVFSVPALSLMITEPSKQPIARRLPSLVQEMEQMREDTWYMCVCVCVCM